MTSGSAFHTNLACLGKFNDKNVWWDNKRNLLYKNDHETFAYCERHCNQSTLEYNEPRPRTPSKALLAIQSQDPLPDQEELQESSDKEDETLDKIRVDIGGSRQVDYSGNQDIPVSNLDGKGRT